MTPETLETLSREQIEAEARRLIAQAHESGRWRDVLDELLALRNRAELIDAMIAEIDRAIG